ncbi:MAG: alpha-L-fucosidase [Firmicutes bacterium]|nr:alpha-L-fucosidase [Bacillota bacterium]
MQNLRMPNYLKDYKELWENDPKAANMKWFKNAKMGLFIHYGLYTALGKNEWVQYFDKIPIDKYENLADNFSPHNFDADYITDLALEANMSYVTMVTCHHDSFCLWDSKTEPFNSMNYCKRDLVREMIEQCNKKGLAFFPYYTFMLNWRNPWFVNHEEYNLARPHYSDRPAQYKYKNKEDFSKYIDYILNCMFELLDNYGPVAGMWLDLIATWYALGPEMIPIEDIYNKLRKRQEHILISWKQGATGTEDFCSTEQYFHSLEDKAFMYGGEAARVRAKHAFEKNRQKHGEVSATIQKDSWSFSAFGKHRTDDYIYNMLGHAMENNCNLCLNIGPMADGSIHPKQAEALKNLGKRVRENGFPKKGSIDFQSETLVPEA